MAEPTKRKIALTNLASDQIDRLYHKLLEKGAKQEAEVLMDDFLDVVFGDIAYFPDRFPVFTGIKDKGDYRMGLLVGDFRVIFQIMLDRVVVLLIMHESELFA
ncbi:MAG: type II toxin-antitoxin system RelE/ParE family toxin [Bacteroidia bacterium]|nr:type II toxin-antitoxin system RelE/ParE family toxin [Bacteroidia bacterium]